MGEFSVKVLLPFTVQTELFDGTFTLLPILVHPVSIKKPFSVSEGYKKTVLSPSTTFCLCFLKEMSSITAPVNDRDPIIFSFSIFILLLLFKASSLDIFFKTNG